MTNYNHQAQQTHILPPPPPPPIPYTSKYVVPELLGNYCTMPIKSFLRFGQDELTEHGYMIYIDNDSDILAVGHLDTVVQEPSWSISKEGRTFYSSWLDDRLGVYTIMDVLPRLGLKYDILLTDGEEQGKSTAQFFKTTKQYKWVFEVDRFGTDVALYQYMNQKEFVDALKLENIPVSRGSNTDITYLGHLGVAAANFACGYYNNHSPQAYAKLDEYDDMVDKIVSFYAKNKDTFYPWVKEEPKQTTYHYSSYASDRWKYFNDLDEYYEERYGVPLNKNKTSKKETAKKHICTDVCPVCSSEFCVGIIKCTCCGFGKHSDLVTAMFGVCAECLEEVYDIDIKLINDVINNTANAGIAIKTIFNTTGLK